MMLFSFLLVILVAGTVLAAPLHGTPTLESELGTNYSTEYLFAKNVSTNQNGGSAVKNIYEWYQADVGITGINIPFESGSTADTTPDYSQTGGTATVNGATYIFTGGYDGFGAYSFPGDLGSAVYINKTVETSSDGYTFACWVSLAEIGTLTEEEERYFIGDSSAPGVGFVVSQINTSGDDYEYILLQSNTSDPSLKYRIDNTWTTNTWYHLATTVDNTGAGIIYVDGASVATAPDVGTAYPVGERNIYFGGNPLTGSTNNLNGTLDDCLFYPEAITAGQVNYLATNRTNFFDPDMFEVDDIWTVNVTPVQVLPFDSGGVGITKTTNSLTILAVPSPPPSAPEFSTITMLLAFGIISGGLIVMRKREG